jgi:hypothetical protein
MGSGDNEIVAPAQSQESPPAQLFDFRIRVAVALSDEVDAEALLKTVTRMRALVSASAARQPQLSDEERAVVQATR